MSEIDLTGYQQEDLGEVRAALQRQRDIARSQKVGTDLSDYQQQDLGAVRAELQRQRALSQQAQIHQRRSQSTRVTMGDRRPADGRYEYRADDGGLGYGHKIGNSETQPGQRTEAITDTYGRVSLNTPAALADKGSGLTVADDPLNLGRCRGYLRGQLWTCREEQETRQTSIVMVGTGQTLLNTTTPGRFWAIASTAVLSGSEWTEGDYPDWSEAIEVYPQAIAAEQQALFVAIPSGLIGLTGAVLGIASRPGVTLALSNRSPYDLINSDVLLNQDRRYLPIVYSEDDGQTWENPKIENTAFARAKAAGASPGEWQMRAIALIDSRFYIVGDGRQVCTSDDGVEWDCQYGEEFGFSYFAVAGEGDRIVVAGTVLAYSPDRGATWIDGYKPSGPFAILESYRKLLFFDRRFFAFGVRPLDDGRLFPQLLVSDDNGESWAGVFLDELAGQAAFEDAAIGAGLVVAILRLGNVGTFTTAIAVVEYSGVTGRSNWRTIANPFTGENEQPQRVTFITTLGQFVIVSDLGNIAVFSNPENIQPQEPQADLRSPLVIYEAIG